MFFIMGISDDRKQLDFRQQMVCSCCGAYGAYQIFVTYTVFSFFFIPLFKWNRRYYVKTTCCGAVSQLDPELGRDIERGRITKLNESDLHFKQQYNYQAEKYCHNCGFRTTENFEFCPHCGNRF